MRGISLRTEPTYVGVLAPERLETSEQVLGRCIIFSIGQREVRLHHHRYQVNEAGLRAPAKLFRLP